MSKYHTCNNFDEVCSDKYCMKNTFSFGNVVRRKEKYKDCYGKEYTSYYNGIVVDINPFDDSVEVLFDRGIEVVSMSDLELVEDNRGKMIVDRHRRWKHE